MPTLNRSGITRHSKIGNTVRFDRMGRNRKVDDEATERSKGNPLQTEYRVCHIL